MFVIHKLVLQPGLGHYSLPIGTEFLHAAIQRGHPMLWYKRPMIAPSMENRMLLLIGTGQEIEAPAPDQRWHFISTMLTEDQSFVFHVFELVHECVRVTGDQLAGEDR